MKHIFAILLLPILVSAQTCKRSGIQCLDDVSYQKCEIVNRKATLVGGPITCANGNVCDDIGCFPCVPKEKATPIPEVAPPACSGQAVAPATQCHQYYECVQNLWWWEPRLQTCPYGQNYKPDLGVCGAVEPNDCSRNGEAPQYSTPACTENGLHPAAKCNQYYECYKCLFWWKTLLKTCPADQAFDEATSQCQNISGNT